MKIEFTDLANLITGGDLGRKVQEIVDAATADPTLAGQQLWHSLVYSGVSLGVDETQRHFTGQIQGTVDMLRDLINRLDTARAMTDDETAIRSLQAIKEHVQTLLKDRASALASTHAKQAAELYGVDPLLITGDLDPEEHPRNMLISAGHTAYRKMPEYFVAWSMGTRLGSLAKLKCHCSQCIRTCVTQGTYENDELDMAMTYFGGLDNTFLTFGVFLITECREALYRELSGLDSTHDAMQGGISGNAEDLTKGFMRNLMGPRMGRPGEPPSSPEGKNG